MNGDVYRYLPPKWYFNPQNIVSLETKSSDLEQMADDGPSFDIQMKLRNARREAETLSKKYFMSSLKGAGIASLGFMSVLLNYMAPQELREIVEYSTPEIVKNSLARGYLVLGGSLVFSAGIMHFFSRASISSRANDSLRKIIDIMIKLGYERKKPKHHDGIDNWLSKNPPPDLNGGDSGMDEDEHEE